MQKQNAIVDEYIINIYYLYIKYILNGHFRRGEV